MTALRQGTDEWKAARLSLITATDIPVLLGLSPYKCEADLADEKRGLSVTESTVRMRMGSFLEPLILEEYEAATGRHATATRSMWKHSTIPWAAASPDAKYVRGGARLLVECKWTTSRSRFADGLPQDIEAQVQWQLGVTGYPAADVAVLTPDGLLPVFSVDYDPALFADLVKVAEDFRRRLAEGGPFAMDKDRIRRQYPSDDGSEMAADAEVAEAVKALIDTRAARKRLEDNEEVLEHAIKARMADHAVMTGDGFRITWKQTKDREEVNWKNLAEGILNILPETERMALVGLNTTVRPGFRPFRVVTEENE